MADSPRLEELRRRVQADPASIAFAALAEEYRRAGKFREAVEASRAGLRYHPTYVSARVTLGRSLVELQEVEQAERELVFVLKSAPDNLSARRALGELCWQQLRFSDALTHFRTAHTLAPADTELPQILQSLERELAADRNGANGKVDAEGKTAETKPAANAAAPAAPPAAPAASPAAAAPVAAATAVPGAARPSESESKAPEAKVVEAKAVEINVVQANATEAGAAEAKAGDECKPAVEAKPAKPEAADEFKPVAAATAAAPEAKAAEPEAAAAGDKAADAKSADASVAIGATAQAAEETPAPAANVASVAETAAAASELIFDGAEEPAKSEYAKSDYGSGTLEIESFATSASDAVSVYAASPVPAEISDLSDIDADIGARSDADNLANADTVALHVTNFASAAEAVPTNDAAAPAEASADASAQRIDRADFAAPADSIAPVEAEAAARSDADVLTSVEAVAWQVTEFAPAEEVASTLDAARSDAEVQAEIDARLEVTSPAYEAVADTHIADTQVADAGLADAGFDGRFGYSQVTDARLADTRLGGMPEVEAGLADAGVAGVPAEEDSIFVAHGEDSQSFSQADSFSQAESLSQSEFESESEFAEFEPIAFVEHEEPATAPAPLVLQPAPTPEPGAMQAVPATEPAVLQAAAPVPVPLSPVTLPRQQNPALIRLERFHRAILVSRARRRSQSHASDSAGQGL